MSALNLRDLTVTRGECPVVDHVSLTVAPGEVIGLIGPNGAGKTTLMRAALGLLRSEGSSSLLALGPAERARAAAWLPQAREIAWPVSVETLVRLGRMPHGAGNSPADDAAVDAALRQCGLESFRTRSATALSGGEQARVLIARALAQDAPLLMADEPIAGLDPAAQIQIMEVFQTLSGEGKAVLVSLHDLGLAARHCTRLVLLHRGRLVAEGPARDVLAAQHLAATFGISGAFVETASGPLFQTLEVLR